MKIPKQLQGTEVKRFIDVNNMFENIVTQGFIKEFYNQPFKSNIMITTSEAIEKYFDVSFNEIVQYYPSNNGKMWFTNTRPRYVFPIPRTLDDFITNCLQAGITLRWKEVMHYNSESSIII